jgi:hypothetical protein
VRPAFARREEGGERDLVVLDAGDVLDDALAVRCPRIDAEVEMFAVSSRSHPIPVADAPVRDLVDDTISLKHSRRRILKTKVNSFV